MEKEKESGCYLQAGSRFVPIKPIKGEFYVKVEDFRCVIEKEVEEYEKKMEGWRIYKKKFASCLRDYKGLIKDYVKLEEENKKLKKELEEVKKDLAHRDSFFSMMYDVLGNENVSSYLLYDIVNAVVKSECGAEEELDEEDLDCLKKFWEGFYKSF